MKILLLAPDYRYRSAWGCELFRDEIARQHDVVRYCGTEGGGDNGQGLHVPDLLARHPDCDIVLMMQLQFGRHYTGIADVKIPTVCWVEDYFPRHYEIKNGWLRQHDFDLVFLMQQHSVVAFNRVHEQCEIPKRTRASWLPFSVCVQTYSASPFSRRTNDVAAIFSAHAFEYPGRAAVVAEINDMLGIRSVARLASKPSEGVYHRSYVRTLQHSKIGVASLDQHGSHSLRHLEIPAAGCMMLTDGPPESFADLRFAEGTHYVLYDNPAALHDKIRYYLEHENERITIAHNGYTLVTGRHSNANRVREMMKAIRKQLFMEDN